MHNISVVMATYNGAKYIEEQLYSLQIQKHAPFELIISDDNSSDGTDSIISRFERTAPFPVKRQRNMQSLGFRDNFLQACSLATGQWIAFCDQDDVWRQDKLQICASFDADRRVTQIVHQANLINDKGKLIGKFNQNISKSGVRAQLSYDVWGTFFGFSMVVRRNVLELVSSRLRYIDYIDPRFLIAHDRWAFFLAQTLGNTVEIAEPLVDYRQHASNVFGAHWADATRETRGSMREKHKAYVSATKQMLEIVFSLPDTTEANFPAFNRIRAEAVYKQALRQVEMRGEVYDGTALNAILKCIENVGRGVYQNAHNGRTRLRSIFKDMSYSLRR